MLYTAEGCRTQPVGNPFLIGCMTYSPSPTVTQQEGEPAGNLSLPPPPMPPPATCFSGRWREEPLAWHQPPKQGAAWAEGWESLCRGASFSPCLQPSEPAGKVSVLPPCQLPERLGTRRRFMLQPGTGPPSRGLYREPLWTDFPPPPAQQAGLRSSRHTPPRDAGLWWGYPNLVHWAVAGGGGEAPTRDPCADPSWGGHC